MYTNRGTGEVNEEVFTSEEVEQGLHLELLNHLLSYNRIAEDYYYEIKITTDGLCTIVQWVEQSYKDEESQGFQYVGYNQTVAEIVEFPDDTYGLAWDKDDAERQLEEWVGNEDEEPVDSPLNATVDTLYNEDKTLRQVREEVEKELREKNEV